MDADEITEDQVADLSALLRTDASLDAKVAQINALRAGMKQHNIPDTCVASIFDSVRFSMASQQAVLVNAGFTALHNLLTRLMRQEPRYLVKEAKHTLPLVIEKVGDAKEKYRILGSQTLTTFWKVTPMDVERVVKNTAMAGKNARAKETSMQWLVQVCHNLL